MSVLDRIGALSPEQRALFEALRAKQKKAQAGPRQPPPIRRVSPPGGAGDWPLTFDQERLWFLHLMEPESTAHNMLTVTRLHGPLDLPALRRAVDGTLARHDAWRATFPLVEGRPVQRVARELVLALPLVDLSGLPSEGRMAPALALAEADARRPFSLATGPLVRATLVRLGAQDHVCILTVHHVVSDWVTFQIFWGELALLYNAARSGKPAPLPPLPVQFADFAVWQREHMAGEVLDAELDWWRRQLAGYPRVLELPTDRPHPKEQSARGGKVEVRLGRETAALRELARRTGTTRFMAVTALAGALFSRLSGQDRLVTGTLNANRSRPEVAGLYGFFLTQLPLPIDLSGDPTVEELLARVRATALGAFAHQDLPFGKLVEALRPERDAARMPLVQALVQLLDASGATSAPGAALAGLTIEPLDVFDGNARYELMLVLYELADDVAGSIEYNADLFDPSTIVRMAELFRALVAAAAEDREQRLSQLPAFPAAVRHQVLAEWNDTAAVEGEPVSVLDRVAARAAEAPDSVAWRGEGWQLTYRELDRRSNRLARHLCRLGVGVEDLVGLYLERTADVPVALLGVLKSGASYLPLDLAHPAERRAFMLEDAGAVAVLTHESLLGGLPAAGPRTVCLDREGGDLERESDEPFACPASAGNRAYLIYTSGSTGRPKGAEITRRSLAHFLAALEQLYAVPPGGAMPGITTIAFDLSVPELYLPMVSGGTTPLLTRETATDGVLLARALAAHGATVLQASPATWRMLLDSGWEGSPGFVALTGAEALTRDLADRLAPRCRELWNFYGPTEVTVWGTAWKVEPEGPISVGRPIGGARVVLLDPSFAPVPLGAVGEIAIGGTGVARGYYRRPDLTAERYVPDPLSPDGRGERLYRTGDLGRFTASGLLQYLGRADFQVKMRGFRIELGEIEAVLREHPEVKEAVVLLREDRPGDQRLTAYVAAPPQVPRGRGEERQRGLRALLAARLPDYMIPSSFVVLPALPRNANLKVDRKALAALRPEGEAQREAERIAPLTPLERQLAALWQAVLDVADVGADDDFFALGGHSLLATQLVLRVRDAFGVELPLRAVFQAPSLAAQAELIAAANSTADPRALPIPRVPRDGDLPLSFAQERLWFLARLTPESPAYNIPVALKVRGLLDVAALERALTTVVSRHEALRTTFTTRDGRPVQVIAGPGDFGLARAAAEDVARQAQEEAATPFDLERGPLLRARLLDVGPREHVLLLTVHHIVADLWAVGLLAREIAQIYSGAELPELPVQYADFAVWQRRWLTGGELERQVAFWRGALAGLPPALDLPTDRPRPPVESFRGAARPLAVSPEVTAALGRLSKEHGATLFMTLSAALSVLLSRWADQDELVLGAPIANRPRPELEGLIGMFVNTLALPMRPGRAESFAALLAQVRRTALDAFEHQDLPFERLVEEIKPRRDLSRHPVFQVVFAMQNVRLGQVEPELALEPVEVPGTTTKFDLTWTLFESAGGLAGQLEYATDLFDAATVERLAGHLGNLLAGLRGESAPSDLPLLAAGERRQLLADFAGTAAEERYATTVHGLFAAQAARTPDAVAVVCGDERLTYAALAARARAVASRLLGLGLRPETRVGIVGERSPELIPGLLGILEAGCAYVPLDPDLPAERRRFLLCDAGVEIVLDEGGESPSASGDLALPAVQPDNLAYVMYTSGSTGTPKGVAVTHRNVVRLAAEWPRGETFLQFAPVAFDASTLEIWAPLLGGGTVVLMPPGRASLDDLAAAIARHGVTSLWLTAGLFHQMVDSRLDGLAPLGTLLAGGDVLSPDHVRRVLAAHPHLALVNGYGPTENTTFTCCHRMNGTTQLDGAVPVGRPIAGTRVLVLDRAMEPAPLGAWGELYAGGAGVSRGYLGRAELTAERFVPDPFVPGERLYRTGDLARFRADGVVEFRGRRDGQVKVRGFRVELGEIEAVLAAHPEVREAVVLLREDRPGDRRLVAYVVTEGGTEGGLRRYLAERLPEPMMPAAVVVLERLPLTPNGKVDRRALPAPDFAAVEYEPPASDLERQIVEVAAEVLGAPRVGLSDNFFALGGHSLLATQLTIRLGERHGLEVPLQLVFDAADFGEMADRIVEREMGRIDPDLLSELLDELEEGR